MTQVVMVVLLITQGGETAFYHSRFQPSIHDPSVVSPIDDSDRGFKVHPGKGGAVLFYNLLEG